MNIKSLALDTLVYTVPSLASIWILDRFHKKAVATLTSQHRAEHDKTFSEAFESGWKNAEEHCYDRHFDHKQEGCSVKPR